jgi:hypothetical protein
MSQLALLIHNKSQHQKAKKISEAPKQLIPTQLHHLLINIFNQRSFKTNILYF